MKISLLIAAALPLLAFARPVIVANPAEPSTLIDGASTVPGMNVFLSDASGAALLNKNVVEIKSSKREESTIPDVTDLKDFDVPARDVANELKGNIQGPGDDNRRSGISLLENTEIHVSDAAQAKSTCLLTNPANCHRKRLLQEDIENNGTEGKILSSL